MDGLYVVATFSISILFMSILWYIKTSLERRKNPPLPPGPLGLPILGYLPFLGNNLFEKFTELGHKYGPIISLYLGNKLCVVINSPSLVKEVVRDQDSVFANRDIPAVAIVATYGANDVVFSELSSMWRAMRKIFAQEMMNAKSLDASYNLRRDQVRTAVRQVHAKIGKTVEIGPLIFRTELKVMMNMLWGGKFEGEEGERIASEFLAVAPKLVDLFGKPNISDFFPLLAGLDIQGVKKQMETYMLIVDKIFETVITQHERNLSGEIKEGKKDLLQILLEIQNKQDSEMSISRRQIKAIFMDTVIGGTDTTAITLEWAMAELMNNPAAMRKAQKELSEVVGLNDIVEELHIPKLKYLEAIIKETMRLHPAIPLLIPRSPSQSSTIGGYTIPKNTTVFINVRSIQRDPSIWDKPLEFRPERFLDDKIEKCDYGGNYFHYLPFGSGRRICAGMPLAERMLMYLLASFLHSFDWKLGQGETLDMSEAFGIVLRKGTPLIAVPSPRLSVSDLYD
ncbi:hypothetical protein ABFS82_05G088900 [Erythranthe guttata]|uniref:geraniol 8-hydroxylase-like n=1 Tax=Erythranthe guttata TaxID=4155 RepID=UPI00064DA586|nr:PREDICTED: geraniol 8-hydroxylase-like [Erythranthe guttata]|eukprot:XP_012857009.1 PREDICTED: geraniol 8-hydroxylase-like [Erythranthe guttata]